MPATEQRYFVVDGQPFVASPNAPIPNIVSICAERIDSRFFAVDVVDRADGCKRIVELGDGQVSDLVRWTPKRFATLWTPQRQVERGQSG